MALNIPYTDVNVRKHLSAGHDTLEAEHAEHSAKLLGVLRGGSSGCVDEGIVYGECHRIAHLRAIGVEKAVSPDRKLMFQAGEGNEDLWEKVLVKGWPGVVLRKQRCEKQGSWGKVSGEPDIILAELLEREQLLWRVGLELKLVCAANSAIYRELLGEPDSKHLIQSAVYMWLTGLPYVLCYTNRTDFALEFQRKKHGGRTKILPFYRMFYLTFKDDRLYYRDEQSSDEHVTRVTGEGIKAYYQKVADMAHTYDLGQRPVNDHVNGAPANWNKCDPKYCAFAGTCDQYETDYATWLDAARSIAQEAP